VRVSIFHLQNHPFYLQPFFPQQYTTSNLKTFNSNQPFNTSNTNKPSIVNMVQLISILTFSAIVLSVCAAPVSSIFQVYQLQGRTTDLNFADQPRSRPSFYSQCRLGQLNRSRLQEPRWISKVLQRKFTIGCAHVPKARPLTTNHRAASLQDH
jgi:hypothetical protein